MAQSTPAKQAWTSQSNQRISSTLPRQNFITDDTKMSFPNDSAIEEEPSSGLVSKRFDIDLIYRFDIKLFLEIMGRRFVVGKSLR